VNVHDAAVHAARYTIEHFPDLPMPMLLQVAGKAHVLTIDVDCSVERMQAVAPLVGRMLRPDSLTFVADAYVTTVADLATHHYGDLEVRYQGGDPTVVECVTVVTAYRLGLPRMTNCPYRRTPDGISWIEEPRDHHEGQSVEGRVHDSLLTALMDQGPPPSFGHVDERTLYQAVAATLSELGVGAEVTTKAP
jgi:hypothetical protein